MLVRREHGEPRGRIHEEFGRVKLPSGSEENDIAGLDAYTGGGEPIEYKPLDPKAIDTLRETIGDEALEELAGRTQVNIPKLKREKPRARSLTADEVVLLEHHPDSPLFHESLIKQCRDYWLEIGVVSSLNDVSREYDSNLPNQSWFSRLINKFNIKQQSERFFMSQRARHVLKENKEQIIVSAISRFEHLPKERQAIYNDELGVNTHLVYTLQDECRKRLQEHGFLKKESELGSGVTKEDIENLKGLLPPTTIERLTAQLPAENSAAKAEVVPPRRTARKIVGRPPKRNLKAA